MNFAETKLRGVYVIELRRIEDERGFFARTFCKKEFEDHDLNSSFVQCNVSFNSIKGTVRGMHYQVAPHQEIKIVRCSVGAIYDVVADLRPVSPTFKQWMALELRADNLRMLYIPDGLAHGFQTLVDNTEVSYQMSEYYHPECARGIRWNDPAFAIEWPLIPSLMSDKDRNYSGYQE